MGGSEAHAAGVCAGAVATLQLDRHEEGAGDTPAPLMFAGLWPISES